MQIAVRGSTGAVSRKRSGHSTTSSSASGKRSLGDERRARVADGDAVAEELAHRHERGDVVARAEDVHVGPRRVRLDEHELVGRSRRRRSRRARAATARARSSSVSAGRSPRTSRCSPKRSSASSRRTVIATGVSFATASAICGTSAGSSAYDGDGDRAAAGEADVEALVVGEPVAADAARRAVQHLGRLADHGGLDAAAGHRAGDLARAGDRERRARIARRRADPLDHGADGDGRPIGRPALENGDDVPH